MGFDFMVKSEKHMYFFTLFLFFFLRDSRFIYLFTYLKDRVYREEETEILHPVVFSPNLQQPGQCQGEARSLELHLWLPNGWQGPKLLGDFLLLSQEH